MHQQPGPGQAVPEAHLRLAGEPYWRTVSLRTVVYRLFAANVPLASMFGNATSLRSRTQGRGTLVMDFDHYAPSPVEVVKERKKAI